MKDNWFKILIILLSMSALYLWYSDIKSRKELSFDHRFGFYVISNSIPIIFDKATGNFSAYLGGQWRFVRSPYDLIHGQLLERVQQGGQKTYNAPDTGNEIAPRTGLPPWFVLDDQKTK